MRGIEGGGLFGQPRRKNLLLLLRMNVHNNPVFLPSLSAPVDKSWGLVSRMSVPTERKSVADKCRSGVVPKAADYLQAPSSGFRRGGDDGRSHPRLLTGGAGASEERPAEPGQPNGKWRCRPGDERAKIFPHLANLKASIELDWIHG